MKHKPIILFADLDGTLIQTRSGKTFQQDYNDWRVPAEIIRAIFNCSPAAICIVTNQGGIEKGFIDEEKWLEKVRAIKAYIKARTLIEVDVKYCTSNDVNDWNRKPNPGMVEEFLSQYGLKPSECLMIGDASGLEGQFSDSDKVCAETAEVPYMDISEFIESYSEA